MPPLNSGTGLNNKTVAGIWGMLGWSQPGRVQDVELLCVCSLHDLLSLAPCRS